MNEKVLIIKVLNHKEAGSYIKEAMKKAFEGEEIGNVLILHSLKELANLLTPGRIEILETIKREQPSSIRDLAKKVGRDIRNVYIDVEKLQAYGFLTLEEKNGRKVPIISYDRIKVDLPIIDLASKHFMEA